LRKFRTGLWGIRQIRRDENLLVIVYHLFIAGERFIGVPEAVWFTGMAFY
jgi:hypothetical protein